MDVILKKLNRQLKHNGRSVLLLMDNAGCHPPELNDSYSNIKVIFCLQTPPPDSSHAPLDLGIIKNFKVHYRKLLLHYVVAKIDECTVASEVTKKINILQAIRWIAEAWEKVTVDTIKKCFRSSGILDSKFELRSLDILNGDDPFEDCDVDGNDTELADLVSRVQVENSCSVEELIHNEDDTPVCGEVTDDT